MTLLTEDQQMFRFHKNTLLVEPEVQRTNLSSKISISRRIIWIEAYANICHVANLKSMNQIAH